MNRFLSKFPALPALPNLSQKTKVVTLGITAGFSLLWVLALLFRKRKDKKEKEQKGSLKDARNRGGRIPLHYSSTNGDLSYRSRSPSSLRSLLRQKSLSGSTASLGAASTSTTSTIIHPGAQDTTDMSPEHLCELGLETLRIAVSYWEDAVMKMGYLDDNPLPAITDPSTASLQHRLEHLLELAYHMQDSYEREVVRATDHMMFDTAINAFTETESLARSRTVSRCSSSDSFVSATDLADLSDLERHQDMFHHLALYEAGVLELKHGSVSCRTLRSEMTDCLSDTEFLAKLHCIRLAMQEIFRVQEHRDYFTEMGRQVISSLLLQAEKDADDFHTAFNTMMAFINNADNWSKMEEELRGRGVKNFTFYDVVLDFILMDAFDDLENPPSTVIAVVNNRWLSNGFKETALSTAVWSVLKAKRRMLKFPDGFIGHFYNVSESVSPVLAWGFLGPESKLKDICFYFKEVVLGFIQDMFSFEKARYTTVDDLASDIVRLAKTRIDQVLQKLNADPT
ncbi:mitoguardin-like [Mya arenaria]|uniref:mitoguardin-like n=1 Tax=Mya arenaria TaxID=6604 RepID=UPI0022DEB9BC|nr:mitoguardin-like [Mya arenaria]